MRVLLDAGADIEARENIDCSPLYYASQEGRLGAVRALLRRGAAVDARLISCETPLVIACDQGYADVVRELLASGADVNAHTAFGTPLIIAIAARRVHDNAEAVVAALLERPDVLVNARGAEGFTALHVAAIKNRTSIVRILLGRADVDATVLDNGGRTALAHSRDQARSLLQQQRPLRANVYGRP
jgi:ankyrin repeat protein